MRGPFGSLAATLLVAGSMVSYEAPTADTVAAPAKPASCVSAKTRSEQEAPLPKWVKGQSGNPRAGRNPSTAA
jgi:hypothetical protein